MTPVTARDAPPNGEFYELRMYVAGQTPKCVRAVDNLADICERHLNGRYRIEIIDLLESPASASTDEIVAVPTLIRRLPPPVRRVIGDLSRTDQVLIGLNLSHAQPTP